ncbi:MAG: hypothetical protein ACKO6N_08335 [Myxococcota bacterium]
MACRSTHAGEVKTLGRCADASASFSPPDHQDLALFWGAMGLYFRNDAGFQREFSPLGDEEPP